MARIPGIRSFFRLPVSEGGVPDDVDEEISFHLEERTRELMARGMDAESARREALREFGDVTEARAELEEIGRRRVRQASRSSWWGDLRQDVRYTGRTLLRAPGFTLVAVLTLALGIGAATAIYTVADGVLLRPLGVGTAEELVVLREYQLDSDRDPRMGAVSPANFFDWQEQARSFSSMAYFAQWPLNLTGDADPQEVQVQLVSSNFFGTLEVQPLLGRTFNPEEGEPPAEGILFGDVAVLSHQLWQGRYGGDPEILGKTIRVDGEPVEVVGVMGPDVRVLDRKPDLWMPLGIAPGNRTSQGRFVTAIARLNPGVAQEQAEREMAGITSRLEEAYPDFNTRWSSTIFSWRDEVVGEVRPALLVLLGAVAMLLLIACTNVANLLLGRASARRQEIAVRLSLGATRGRLIRQVLTESLVLAMLGGALGLLAAVVGTQALVRSMPDSVQLPRLDAVQMDARILGFALVVTLLTGVLFGLAPALVSSRSQLQGSLRDSGRGSTSGRSSLRLRNALVVAEVGLALVLLVSAGLLLRSFQKLQEVDTGIRAEGVLTLRMSLGADVYPEAADLRGFLARLLPALHGLPGVEAVGTTSHLPLTDGGTGHTAYRPDRPAPEPGEEPGVDIRVVGGGYFAAQGVGLVSGRVFDERDHVEAPNAFIINGALARQQFPGEDPVGKQLVYPWPDLIEGTIVGVVDDVRQASVTGEPAPALYRTFDQWLDRNLNVVIRTSGDPAALVAAVREPIRQLDANLPIASIRPMEAVVADATARSRMSSYLLAAFAGLALLLAAVGLYGIISYGVAQRRGEIGVRVALGANRGDILRLVVRQGMTLTAAGLALGLVGALAVTRLLQSLLFGVTTTDSITFIAVPVLLSGVALLASYLPASRAARVDPATALRAQ